jgi:hypothetical protein
MDTIGYEKTEDKIITIHPSQKIWVKHGMMDEGRGRDVFFEHVGKERERKGGCSRTYASGKPDGNGPRSEVCSKECFKDDGNGGLTLGKGGGGQGEKACHGGKHAHHFEIVDERKRVERRKAAEEGSVVYKKRRKEERRKERRKGKERASRK